MFIWLWLNAFFGLTTFLFVFDRKWKLGYHVLKEGWSEMGWSEGVRGDGGGLNGIGWVDVDLRESTLC